jgi:hypothetical protein
MRLHLNSDDADIYPKGEGDHSSVIFTLTDDVSTKSAESIWVRMVWLSVPNTMYNIRSDNNSLLAGNTTINVPPGSYTADVLVEDVNALLVTATEDVSFTYSETTGKVTAIQGTSALDWSASPLLSGPLGFDPTTTVESPATVVATKCVDLLGPRAILVSCPQLQTMSIDSAGRTSVRSIVGSGPIDVAFGGIQTVEHEDSQLLRTSTRSINIIRIDLLDEAYSPLQLNGARWSCVLELDVV